jgi:hypothetical protein
MLDAAVDVVEGIVGPITSETVTETHYRVSSDVLVLRRMPVADLLSSVYRYRVPRRRTCCCRRLRARRGHGHRPVGVGWLVRGSYTGHVLGRRPTVPAAVRQALLIIAAHLWETQRGAAPVGPLAADDTGAHSRPWVRGPEPGRRELLAPYRQIVDRVNAALPLVIDRLVSLLPTLPGWSGVTVFDGPQVTAAAPRGVRHSRICRRRGLRRHVRAGRRARRLLEESGTVRSEIVCQTGDVDFPAAGPGVRVVQRLEGSAAGRSDPRRCRAPRPCRRGLCQCRTTRARRCAWWRR